jgi:hypothetical protein
MKIFPETSLFNDPIKWVKASVGSKFKFWFWVFIHLLSGAFVLYTSQKGSVGQSWWWIFVVVYFMIVMPFSYLYALRKLLLELQKRDKN